MRPRKILKTYDSIDEHLAVAREFDRAAIPMGMYLAWALNLGLVNSQVLADHEQLVMRVRIQDAKGSEFLMAFGGVLNEALFNDRGRRFTQNYYSRYLEDYSSIFEQDPYLVEDTWTNYDRVARFLTKELMGGPGSIGRAVSQIRKGSTELVNFWKSIWRSG